jgi:hypothetical protein
MSGTTEYPCPCCGFLVFEEPPGSDDICPICFWEDDISQLRFPEMPVGANRVSLIEAQRNFQNLGASVIRLLPNVRKPTPGDKHDPEWRPIDEATDNVEKGVSGVEYGLTYPQDGTSLYYWRHDYWRKTVPDGEGM